jgi:hypothetical protein
MSPFWFGFWVPLIWFGACPPPMFDFNLDKKAPPTWSWTSFGLGITTTVLLIVGGIAAIGFLIVK